MALIRLSSNKNPADLENVGCYRCLLHVLQVLNLVPQYRIFKNRLIKTKMHFVSLNKKKLRVAAILLYVFLKEQSQCTRE